MGQSQWEEPRNIILEFERKKKLRNLTAERKGRANSDLDSGLGISFVYGVLFTCLNQR